MSTQDPGKSPAAATDVSEFITDLDGGQFERMLSVALSKSAAAAVDNQKTAEVTIKLKLKPIGGSHMVHIDHTLTFKRPTETGESSEKAQRVTTLHVGKFGKLTLVPESQTSFLDKTSGQVKA
jgi:hypothetical protein